MKLLLANIRWSDSSVEPWSAASSRAVADNICSFWQEASYGALVYDATISPWVTAPISSLQVTCSTSYSFASWFSAANTGINAGLFDHVIYSTPRSGGCAPKGLNYGAAWTWNNSGGVELWHTFCPLHELGHSLGLRHVGGLRILNYPSDGSTFTFPDPLKTTGEAVTVRDTTGGLDVMGYNPFFSIHPSAAGKHQRHWITPVVFAGGDVTYDLTPMAQAGGSLYGVHIPMDHWFPTSRWQFWVEYRKPINRDEVIGREGIIITFMGGLGCEDQYYTLDAHGNTQESIDAFMNVGETFSCGPVKMRVVGPGQIRLWDGTGGIVNTPPQKPTMPLTVVSVSLDSTK